MGLISRNRKFKEQNYLTKKNHIIFSAYFSSIVLCSIILLADAAQNDQISSNCNPKDNPSNCLNTPRPSRSPRDEQQQRPPPASESLKFLINWLFGPPAPTVSPFTKNSFVNSDNKKEASIGASEKDTAASSVSSLKNAEKSNSSDDKSDAGQQRAKKNIEITDIQASIGTELHSSQLHGDPSQVNLKHELDLVEKFDQSVKQRPHALLKSDKNTISRTGRLKREQYKPIKVPYTTSKTNTMNNNLFRQRQLLVNPFEQQQMMALQQQQAAAAAMLHQQQMDNLLAASGNRYSLLDDYDREDDDDSDEDSDEFDDFTRFGPPLVEHHHMYLRDGLPPQIPIPPFQRKLGWGLRRRSVSDKKKQETRKSENRESETRRESDSKRGQKKYKNRASMRNGQWFLDDYDLNSEFYDKPQERKNLPLHLRNSNDHVERPELDEEEHFNRQDENNDRRRDVESKFRGDMEHFYRQEEGESTSESSSTTEAGGESSVAPPVADATTEEGGSSTTEGGSSSTTAGGSSVAPPVGDVTTEAGGSSSTTAGGSSTTSGGNSSTTSSGSSTTAGSSTPIPDASETPIGDSSTTEAMNSTSDSSTTESSETGSTTEQSSTNSSNTTTQAPKPKPPYKATLNCRCGAQSVRGHEVDHGTVVRSSTNPWLVAIANKTGHMCSGSIVNDRFILTSKSCVRDASPGSLKVTPGLATRNSKTLSVTKITSNKNTNIALLQLNSAIKPSSDMRPVCLPIGKRYAGQYSTGKLVTFKRTASNLQMIDTEVSILAKNNSRCMSTSKHTLCAGPPGTMKCGGDTGGILMVYRGGYSYEQIGVVAGTVGCRTSKMPGVYTG